MYHTQLGINHEQDHTEVSNKDPSCDEGNVYHPAWGNFNHDSGGECGVLVFYRFHIPDNGNKIWWYSYVYGLVLFDKSSFGRRSFVKEATSQISMITLNNLLTK